MKYKGLTVSLITSHVVTGDRPRVSILSVDFRLPNAISTGMTIANYLCFSITIVLPDKRRG